MKRDGKGVQVRSFIKFPPSTPTQKQRGGMSTILSFRDLEVWQFGMELVVRVYRATESFPPQERYGLTSQMRRAVVSVPSNIAEGHARRDGAYLNHVKIALGSQAELGTEIEAALRLGLLEREKAKSLLNDVERLRKMLYALRRSLQAKRNLALSLGGIVFFYFVTPLI